VDKKTIDRVEREAFVHEQRRLSIEANLAQVQRERELPEGTGVEPAACDRHPNWRPKKRAWWLPRKPSYMCDMCAAEIDQLPKGPDVYIDGNPRRELPLSPRHAEMAARNIAKANGVAPGSPEETAALERIDELRADEKRTSKSRRRGVPAFQKMEEGQLVTYVDTRSSIRQRPQLVRGRP
jgi:hypothetical protein